MSNPPGGDLKVRRGIVVPAAELEERFTPTGGPGGQHANRSSTRVVLRFDVASSEALSASQRERVVARLGPVVTVVADGARSQHRNREAARARLAERLREALVQERSRRRTRPSRSANARRLKEKKRRSEIKQQRRRPGPE